MVQVKGMVNVFYLTGIIAILYLVLCKNGKSVKYHKYTKELAKEYSQQEKLEAKAVKLKKYLAKFDELVTDIPYLNKVREELIHYMELLNFEERETCYQTITFRMFVVVVGATGVGLLVFAMMQTWYMFLGAFGIVFFLGFRSLVDSYKKRINKLYLQLPDALQIFLDNYVTTHNVKSSLDAVPKQLKGDINVLFQKLSRRVSSGDNSAQAVMQFAEDLDYFWGYAFAELLIIAMTTSGDITEDITFLIKTINSSIKEDMESIAAVSASKSLVNAMNGAGAIGLAVEFTFVKFARDFYVYSSMGNMIILFFLIEIIASNIMLTLMEDL